MTGQPFSYDTNCLNQYTAVGPQGSQTSYYYDKNGNLTDDGQYKYYYDCENRLTDVNDQNDDPIASYKYDYQGRRISKTVYGSPSATTKYAYDGDQVIAEYDEGYNLLRKFIYGPGIDEPICMIDVADGNTIYYYHFDGLGSVAALSDVNSVIVERYSYDVFGEPNRTSDVNNPYLFTSRRYDDESGLYYYRARYYDYADGRFLVPDPIGYDDGMNLYTYVGNNPLAWIDPYGFCKDDKIERMKRLQNYIESAEAAMIANMEVLKGLHAEIRSTHTYYRNVLIADTALSVFTTTRSAFKLAGGIGKMRSATRPLGTNLIQEMAYGPGKNVGLANLGERLALQGANDFIKTGLINTVVVLPATKLSPRIFDVELSIAGARRKVVTKHEKQAQEIMDTINILSQGISQAKQMLRELR